MGKFFIRERFGRPQVLAGSLLLIFVGQCLWLLARGTSPLDVDSAQLFRVQEGVRQWQGNGIAGTPSPERLEAASGPPAEIEENQGYDPHHSPLWYLVASAAFARSPDMATIRSVRYWGWLARLPYTVCGVLLGASLWYVARRLYGNAGGFIALSLYCFSPAMIENSTLWLVQPDMPATWGTFGAFFTSIAVAHTLYAPREVVLWNWRRILLLGLSLALAVGCQFSLLLLLPVSLALMWYVAPNRRLAALAIWATACAVAFALLFAAYRFDAQAGWKGVQHLRWIDLSARAFAMGAAYQSVGSELLKGGPSLVLALPFAIATYSLWPRARYFGNSVPLLLALFFLILSLSTAHAGTGFELIALPFLFIFVAGITTDLLETNYRKLILASVWGWLTGNALWNLVQLAKVGRG
ncbi:MAG TPA: hypothetical protein VEI52_28450 [Terriglobales bacterium]|nr:hypothetical protein [Terriglobales bacterium]